MKKLVSIIIPVYNVEKYLYECLDSVINQTYKNIEIILVNDGSTDHSLNICKEYSEKDSRIKLIDNKINKGLSYSRNIGIKESKGEYIYFVDSDDYIFNESVIEDMMSLLDDNDLDIVSAYYYERMEFSKISVLNSDENTIDIISPIEAINRIYDTKKYRYNYTVVTNKIYRKYLFNDINYPENKIHEDEYVTYKLYLKSKNIVVLNKYTYIYRVRDNSIMSSSYSLKRLDAIDAYKERIEILKSFNQNDLVKKTNLAYFINLEINRYMLLKNKYYKEYDVLNREYKRFLKVNKTFIFNKIRIKYFIKKLLFKIFRK